MEETLPGPLLEQLLSLIIEYVSFGIDVASGFIIGTSVVIAIIGYARTLGRAQKVGQGRIRESIRFRLAGGLLLALDFQVGSDILKTILVPTTNELIMLAVIVGLRIVLGWSLSKEISGHSEDLLTK
ncbi:MAG TPA: DUF1622 domain-containing protein [Nitrososphaera sp.]|jgi:uncharacterized membrane protein